MTEAQLDLAHKLVSELAMYANAAQQYGHGGMTAAMRNAASLLQQMVDEAELEAARQRLARIAERRQENPSVEQQDG